MITTYQSRDEWLAARQHNIGGSDVAAILGQHPYKDAFDVWLEKKGYPVKEAGGKAKRQRDVRMAVGLLVEPRIMQLHESAVQLHFTRSPHTLWQHDTSPWMVGSPDALCESYGIGAEYKSVGWRAAKRWNPEARIGPMEAEIQARWYQALTNFDMWHVVGLLGEEQHLAALTGVELDAQELMHDGHLALVEVKRDPELEALLIEAADKFRVDHLLTDEPPKPTDPRRFEEYLRIRFSDYSTEFIETSEDLEWKIVGYRQAVKDEQEAKERKDANKLGLLEAIGNYTGILGADGKPIVTWKQTRGRVETNYEAALDFVHQVLLERAENDHEHSAIDDLMAQAVRETTTEIDGTRRFYIAKQKEEN